MRRGTTESPFVFNGRGLIQGKRSALFLYEVKENKLRRLTGKYMDVGSFRVHGQEVYFSGVNFRNRRPNRDCLYRLDLETGKTEQVLGPRLLIYAIEFIGDALVVIGADGKRYGDNENPCFYTFDPQSKELKLLCEADESLGNAMLTDVEYGAARFTKAEGDHLYFPALDRDGCKLKRIGLDGVIETAVSTDGILSDYDVHEGNVFFAGMLDMKLPEIYQAGKDGNRRLTAWNEDVLKDVYVARPQPITAELDGEEIDGWVLLPEDYDPEKNTPRCWISTAGPSAPTARCSSMRCRPGPPRATSCFSAIPTARTAGATPSPISICSGAASTTARSWPLRTRCWRPIRPSTPSGCAAPAAPMADT